MTTTKHQPTSSSAPRQERFAPTHRLWATLALAITISACAHVHPYPVTVKPPDYPLVVAPAGLADWDSGLAEQLHATSRYCAVVRHAVISEAEQRRDRAGTMRNWFTAIGSLATLAQVSYRDVVDAPKEVVTVSLTAVASSSFYGAVRSLFEANDRVAQLEEKADELDDKEASVVALLQSFERRLLERTLALRQDNTAANRAEQTRAIMPLEEDFREALIAWRRECE